MRQAISGLFLSLVFLLLILPLILIVGPRFSGKGISVHLYLTEKKKIITVPLEEYIKGVVAAEMPAQFHPEALKAQAVAARTVTIKRLKRFGGRGCKVSPKADFSDDFRDGQAWLSRQELVKKWGFWGYRRNWARISRAVEETAGLILTYQGVPIDAVYHSTSGPRTENSEEVWGVYYPYLRSVECPYDKHSPRYTETKVITFSELHSKLGLAFSVPAGAGSALIRIHSLTGGGRVKELTVGGKIMRGEDFRLALGLKSSRFKYETGRDYIRFTTVGYGHGVGMCQYGADGMAKVGKNFCDILLYYYRGVEIKRLKN